MRKNQRDGLRLLGLDELGKLDRIGFLKIVETRQCALKRNIQIIQKLFGRFRAKGFDQQFLGKFRSPPRQKCLGQRQTIKIFHNGIGDFGIDFSEPRYFFADLLDFILLHEPENSGAGLISQKTIKIAAFLAPVICAWATFRPSLATWCESVEKPSQDLFLLYPQAFSSLPQICGRRYRHMRFLHQLPLDLLVAGFQGNNVFRKIGFCRMKRASVSWLFWRG